MKDIEKKTRIEQEVERVMSLVKLNPQQWGEIKWGMIKLIQSEKTQEKQKTLQDIRGEILYSKKKVDYKEGYQSAMDDVLELLK